MTEFTDNRARTSCDAIPQQTGSGQQAGQNASAVISNNQKQVCSQGNLSPTFQAKHDQNSNRQTIATDALVLVAAKQQLPNLYHTHAEQITTYTSVVEPASTGASQSNAKV